MQSYVRSTWNFITLGTTHKREWDCFTRAISNRKAFPADLSVYAMKQKKDLFAAWLEAGRSWDKARLIITRTHKNENESLAGWVAKCGRDLVKEFGEEKAKKLFAARTAAGLYYNSDDFPDDELERFYYMKKPREVNRRQVTSDSTQVKADANLDNDMLNALVDENEGVMRAGALPECFASNTAGQKAFMDGLFDGVVAAPKKKAKKEEEKSKEVQPKTLPQKACDLMADILSDSTKARKKSMSLGAVNYAGELSNQLLDFAKKMEHSYKTLQKATNNNVDKEDFYLKIFAEVAKQREWFVQAEAWLGLKLL